MNRLIALLFVLSVMILSGQVAADPLTPGKWIEIELQVKELTVEGMKERYRLLAENTNLEHQYNADAQTQSQINRVYENHHTTAIKHQNYGQQHIKDIEREIMQNPVAQQRFEQVDRDFHTYVELISNQQQTN